MSKDSPEMGPEDARLAEAARWYARHGSSEELSRAAIQEWEEWMRHPDNRAEYTGVARLVAQLGHSSAPPLRSAAEVRAGRSDSGGVDSPRKHRIQWRVAAAASIVCAVGVLAFATFHMTRNHDAIVTRDEYVTAPGAHRQLRLEDGSEVTLAGDSAIRVLYSERQRSVLFERGEALFRVSRSPGRPFTVLAGGGRITALGTEFDVRLDSAHVVVGVIDGSVEVAPRDGATRNSKSNALKDERESSGPVRLRKGQQLGYDFRGDATLPTPTDAQSIVAWTQGSITYRDRPLKEVLEDVQRYTARRIYLDPAADEVPFSGIFVERDAEAWIGLLPRALPVDVVNDMDGIRIQLRSASASGSVRAGTSPSAATPR